MNNGMSNYDYNDNGRARLLERFPHGNDLMRWATPANWAPFATSDYTRLVGHTCPRLSELKAIYGMTTLAADIVYQNISKVVSMSSTRFAPGDGVVRTASDLFLGRYGKSCTVYMMLTYFANYLTDYKKTVSTFDLGDLLSGYRQFEDKWNAAIGRLMDAQSAAQGRGYGSVVAGIPALKDFIRGAVSQHGVDGYIQEGTRLYDPESEDPQERMSPECGGLLRFGIITPEEVKAIADGTAGTAPPGDTALSGDMAPQGGMAPDAPF